MVWRPRNVTAHSQIHIQQEAMATTTKSTLYTVHHINTHSIHSHHTRMPHAHFDTATTPPVEKEGEINFESSTPNASHEQAIPFSRWVPSGGLCLEV